jgi:predicted peptidase
MLSALICTSALWLSVNGPFEPKEFPKLFEVGEYQCTDGPLRDKVLPYRLFVPRNLKSGEHCPMLVWLHGKGESGDDNEWNLKYLSMIIDPEKPVEQYRFFILATQCPENVGWISGTDDSNGDMLAITYQILQKILQEQPVDQQRIYLSGVSSGGAGCWEMAMRHPELFAAVSPMSSGGGDAIRASKLANIPIWAFHCQYDKPEGVEQMVAAIEKAGGNAQLTILRSGDHDSWNGALRVYDSFHWLLCQRRGAWIQWTPPGHRPWKWWHVFGVPLAFIAIVGLGWHSERRRRRKHHRQGKTHVSEKS